MKRMIMCTVIFVSILRCMERELISTHVKYNTVPPIFLIKDSLLNRQYSKSTDVLVVGATEQCVIRGECLNEHWVAGDILKPSYNALWCLDAVFKKYCNYRERLVDEPFSIVIEGKKFNVTNINEYREIECINDIVILPIEPRIMGSIGREKEYFYSTYRRKISGKETIVTLENFYDQEALQEGEKDLALCYIQSLKKAPQFVPQKEKISIAFSALSILLGVPHDNAARVMATSLHEFIKNEVDVNKYEEIQIVTEDDSYFEACKKMLNEKLQAIITDNKK